MKKAFVILLCLGIFKDAPAQVEKIQAAFIYNFTMLVNWPSSQQTGDFVISVFGNSPICKELDEMAKQKKAGNQTISIKRINSAQEIGNAQIVFIPDAQKSKIQEVVAKTSSNPTLVVTESQGAAAQGSIINFIQVEQKLKFEISEKNASSKGLKLASNLVKLGIPVN